MPHRAPVVRVALAGALALGLTSCGFLGSGPWHGRAFDDTRNGFKTYDVEGRYSSVNDLVKASMSQASGGGLDAVVIGSVVAVEPGRSLTWNITDDGDERVELPFGDDESMIDTFHLTVEVTDVVVQGVGVDIARGELSVGVGHNPDVSLDNVTHDYEGVGEVVFFLRADSPRYDYADDMWSIDYNDSLLGRVGDDGEIDFPLIPRTDPLWDTQGVTVERLRALSADD